MNLAFEESNLTLANKASIVPLLFLSLSEACLPETGLEQHSTSLGTQNHRGLQPPIQSLAFTLPSFFSLAPTHLMSAWYV